MDIQRTEPDSFTGDAVREGRSVAALILIMALVFIAYFAMRVAVPELPLHVHQALASLPSKGSR